VCIIIYLNKRKDLNIPGKFNMSVLGLPALLRGGADKSLARPGRKQATAIQLGIYSTHSPRSSIHFLFGCSNICKTLKKNFRKSNRVSTAAMTSASEEKWRLFNCFSVQGTGGSPTGPDPENRVGDQDTGSLVLDDPKQWLPRRQVSSGLQVPGELGHGRASTRPPWWPSRGVFPSNTAMSPLQWLLFCLRVTVI
jgi:hypothetical protein